MEPKAKKSKKKKTPARPPKAAPVSVVKDAGKIEGPRPLSAFDYQFCQGFVQTGKQVQAYRDLRPDAKDPHVAAYRMMQRPEIREHIREIYKEVSRDRQRAAQIAARSTLLTLEVADDRLMEILQTRRKSRGEMFTKDLKIMMVDGAVAQHDDDGNVVGYSVDAALKESLSEGQPVDDKDLLQAVKLAYDRKGGIIKAEKEQAVGPVTVMLYKPKWFGQSREQKTIEAAG